MSAHFCIGHADTVQSVPVLALLHWASAQVAIGGLSVQGQYLYVGFRYSQWRDRVEQEFVRGFSDNGDLSV